jgi:hypothetical protein
MNFNEIVPKTFIDGSLSVIIESRKFTFNEKLITKKEGESPRLKCFHNGIILIVNCLR